MPRPIEILPDQKSGWALFLRICAVLCLVSGFVGCWANMSASKVGDATALIWAVIGGVACVQFFFIAFLVDVFTDMRYHLAKLSRKD